MRGRRSSISAARPYVLEEPGFMQNSSNDILVAGGMVKTFPGAIALNKVDFSLRRGEVHALLGENGAGKSTLIKCMTGAYRRDAGQLTLDGEDIDPRDTLDAQKLGIGTVYQEVNLLGNLSVAENLFLGRQPRRFGLIQTGEMNRGREHCLRSMVSTSTSRQRSKAIPSRSSRWWRSRAPSISPARS